MHKRISFRSEIGKNSVPVPVRFLLDLWVGSGAHQKHIIMHRICISILPCISFDLQHVVICFCFFLNIELVNYLFDFDGSISGIRVRNGFEGSTVGLYVSTLFYVLIDVKVVGNIMDCV
ncbi:hypothetical protein HanPI659440_Chr08g0288631 [Helianthus annuus]|nr:hypothetical protein HanPI659440_Chr08g0288631 [Helianthus annuus]